MIRIKKIKQLSLLVIISLFNLLAYADVNDTGVKIKWGYRENVGPSRWSQLDPSFAICSSGKLQSPVSIGKQVKNAKNVLKINYQPAPMLIIDDGNTELMIGNTQTIINDSHSIQLNFPVNQTKESITFDGKDYRLVQFHLHSPSENQWRDQSFPMEIDFVHQSDDGKLAVLGVFVKGGKANASLQKIIDHLPTEKGKEIEVTGERIDPIDLIPPKQNYYSFIGSLTTPPCTEGVQWIIMANPITASPAQILQLRKAVGVINARPVMPLNGRPVSFSVDIQG